jgi:CRP-like cAMP-binding protein
MTTLSSASKLDALRRCGVFARIPAGALGVLAEILTSETLRAGEVLFEHGEPSDRAHVVVSGRLSVRVPGRSEPVRQLAAGQLLGEYGMFGGQVRTATVLADEASVLLSLDYERFRAFLHQFPEAMFVLLGTAVERLLEAERG